MHLACCSVDLCSSPHSWSAQHGSPADVSPTPHPVPSLSSSADRRAAHIQSGTTPFQYGLPPWTSRSTHDEPGTPTSPAPVSPACNAQAPCAWWDGRGKKQRQDGSGARGGGDGQSGKRWRTFGLYYQYTPRYMYSRDCSVYVAHFSVHTHTHTE